MEWMQEDPNGEWVRFDDAMADRLRMENAYEAMREFDEFIKEHNKAAKVFCRECKYLGATWSDGHGCGEGTYMCRSPLNIKDTWFKPNDNLARTPQELNKNNDCKYFERK